MQKLPVLLLGLMLQAFPAWSAEIMVPARPEALVNALKTAQAGDILRLSPGTHRGPIVIDTPVIVDGSNGAEIRGNGKGSVINITVAGVTIRQTTISGSGSSDKDAGVNLGKDARRAIIENNRIIGNLIGVNVQGAKDAIIRNNVIEGRRDARMNNRGNGVYVWNAPGTKVTGNDIRWGRDGIFVNASINNEFSGNRFRDLRFAVHYMYAHDSVVADNLSIGNHLGFAVMFSNNVTIRDNLSKGDRNYGIMLNYTNDSRITGNRIEETSDRCIFIYNAHKNQIEGNLFKGCNIGVHFTAGSKRNRITGNSFINNQTQVKYVGTKWVNWSNNGRGNYWSNHTTFDIDGNGIGDTTFRPNDIMDRILWTQPAAKSLLGSPAVQLIRWSQSAFPALLPGGVIDSFPLMKPVEPEISPWKDMQ